jgi:hypothetical protein
MTADLPSACQGQMPHWGPTQSMDLRQGNGIKREGQTVLRETQRAVTRFGGMAVFTLPCARRSVPVAPDSP